MSLGTESIVLSPNVLAVRHWNRLLGGALYAATERVDWTTLLRRSFDVDVLACATCGGRLRVLAVAKMSAMNPVAVSGVGDQAFRDTGDFGPTAEHGGVMCTVSTASAVQIPGVDALVQNGTLNLTEAQNGILAAALGTVCNRIFGSGNTTPMLGGL